MRAAPTRLAPWTRGRPAGPARGHITAGARPSIPARPRGYLIACAAALVLLSLASAMSQEWSPDTNAGNDATGWDTSGVAIIDLETRLAWLADSLRWAWHAAPCEGTPSAPYQLPPRPEADALGVVFADGRRARWDPLLIIEGERYWPMERACAALGGTLHWAPGHFSGQLLVDTLAFRFAVGSEIIHCGLEARQLPAPVRYERNRLLMPVEFVTRLVRPFLAHRFALRADSLVLAQKAAGPVCDDYRVLDAHGRTALVWQLPAEPQAQLRIDGGALLAVDLPGVYVDPLKRVMEQSTDDVSLCAVRPHARGTEFTFRVGPRIVAWETQWRESQQEFRVVLSPLAGDLGRGSAFEQWPASQATERPASPERRVVIVLPTPEAARGLEGSLRDRISGVLEYACTLGDRVRERLDEVDIEVELVDVGGHPALTEWAERANSERAVACLILRPDICGDALGIGFRIVTAANGPGERPMQDLTRAHAFGEVRRDQAGLPPVAIRTWDQVAPQHGASSEALAWLLMQHLQLVLREGGIEGGEQAATWQRWPTGLLEGMDLPAAVLYVGASAAGRGFPDDEDWQRLDDIALAVALALETFHARCQELSP